MHTTAIIQHLDYAQQIWSYLPCRLVGKLRQNKHLLAMINKHFLNTVQRVTVENHLDVGFVICNVKYFPHAYICVRHLPKHVPMQVLQTLYQHVHESHYHIDVGMPKLQVLHANEYNTEQYYRVNDYLDRYHGVKELYVQNVDLSYSEEEDVIVHPHVKIIRGLSSTTADLQNTIEANITTFNMLSGDPSILSRYKSLKSLTAQCVSLDTLECVTTELEDLTVTNDCYIYFLERFSKLKQLKIWSFVDIDASECPKFPLLQHATFYCNVNNSLSTITAFAYVNTIELHFFAFKDATTCDIPLDLSFTHLSLHDKQPIANTSRIVPNWLPNCTQLVSLSINYKLTQNLQMNWKSFTCLKHLNIIYDASCRFFKGIEKIPNLQTLHVTTMDELPEEFFDGTHLPHLSHLHIRDIYDFDMDLSNCKKLQTVRLFTSAKKRTFNNMADQHAATLAQVASLRFACENAFIVPVHICSLVRQVTLSENRLEWHVDNRFIFHVNANFEQDGLIIYNVQYVHDEDDVKSTQ